MKTKGYTYTQTEALLMDQELDIVHACLTELYSHDDNSVGDTVKKYLNRIEKEITS